MKISKKGLIIVLLISFLGYSIYTEKYGNNVSEIKSQKVNIDVSNINKIIETINTIDQIWVGQEKVDKDKMYEAALTGIVKSLDDPYSEYLTKEDLKELNEGMNGTYVGLGMSIRKEKGDYLEIVSPFIGTPAFKAGLQIGDIITKVDDKDILDLTAIETTKLLRGEENTEVKIEVLRKGLKKPKEFVLKREKIKLDNVEYKMLDLENKIGYISLLNFGEDTAREIKDALIDLKDKGMEKLIFDLRTNPGGSLNEAIEISSLFVKEDLIVSLTYKNGQEKKYNREGDQIFDGDMVILINRGSASASEIVTGVLKDYKRGTIIGEKSFGKGVVQNILPYRDSKGDALKLTIAEYFTPSKHKINKNGIEPNIIINMNTLLSSKGYSSETLEAKENRKKAIFKILEEMEGHDKAEEIIKEGDRQLKSAIDYLLGKKVVSEKPEEKETKKDKILKENKGE